MTVAPSSGVICQGEIVDGCRPMSDQRRAPIRGCLAGPVRSTRGDVVVAARGWRVLFRHALLYEHWSLGERRKMRRGDRVKKACCCHTHTLPEGPHPGTLFSCRKDSRAGQWTQLAPASKGRSVVRLFPRGQKRCPGPPDSCKDSSPDWTPA